MNQYSITLESIDELDSVVTESAIDVLLSICESADKISDMLNNSATGFYQEATEPEKKDSVLKTILMLPIKLIQAIIKLFTGKDAEKDKKESKEVSEKLKNEDQSKISALFSYIGEHKKSLAVGTLVLSATAAAIFRKSVMNAVKLITSSITHLFTKMSSEKVDIVFDIDEKGRLKTNVKFGNLADFYNDIKALFEKVGRTRKAPPAAESNKILKKWIVNGGVIKFTKTQSDELISEWNSNFRTMHDNDIVLTKAINIFKDQSSFKFNPPDNENDQTAFNKLLELTLTVMQEMKKIYNATLDIDKAVEKALDEASKNGESGQNPTDEKEEQVKGSTGKPTEKVEEGKKPEPPEEKNENPTGGKTKPTKKFKVGEKVSGKDIFDFLIRGKYSDYKLDKDNGLITYISKSSTSKYAKHKLLTVIGKYYCPNIGELCDDKDPVFVWDDHTNKYIVCSYDEKPGGGFIVERGKERDERFITPSDDDDLI